MVFTLNMTNEFYSAHPEVVRILQVEPSDTEAHLIKELLSRDTGVNLTLDRVTRMVDAEQAVSEKEYDAILLDLELPDCSGLATLERMMAVDPGVPIVVISEHNDEDLAISTMQHGAQDYVPLEEDAPILMKRSIRYAIERKNLEKKLFYLARYDGLTGLVSRSTFQEYVSRAIFRCKRNKDLLAVLSIGLDHFKFVNDSLGYEIGDELLKWVTMRVRTVVRGEDILGRVGGDEFILLLEGVDKHEDLISVSEKIVRNLSEPFLYDDHEINITTSIGIATYPHCGDDSYTLMQNADAALQRVKDEGKNSFQFFTSEMNEELMKRMNIVRDMHRALQSEEFCLYYQPRYNLETSKLISMEALIRWKHPTLGLVSPDEFIPIAEETGQIVAIGRWVLYEVGRQLMKWRELGLPDQRVSINVSGKQFQKGSLVDDIHRMLDEYSIHSDAIELELTERVLIENIERNKGILEDISRLGVGLSIDDFGIGYSSLSYLREFPISVLKIDRSFVADVIDDPDDAAIVKAIISLGQSLGVCVVAEGVETCEQLNFLTDNGCDEVQGFLLSKPVTSERVAEVINFDAFKSLRR